MIFLVMVPSAALSRIARSSLDTPRTQGRSDGACDGGFLGASDAHTRSACRPGTGPFTVRGATMGRIGSVTRNAWG